MRIGGQILVDQLLLHGVDTAYTVPGESFLPVLDALYEAKDEIKLIAARHEGGAANMAEHAKLGKPGKQNRPVRKHIVPIARVRLPGSKGRARIRRSGRGSDAGLRRRAGGRFT